MGGLLCLRVPRARGLREESGARGRHLRPATRERMSRARRAKRPHVAVDRVGPRHLLIQNRRAPQNLRGHSRNFMLTPSFPNVKFDNFRPSRTHCSTQGEDRNPLIPSRSKQTELLYYSAVLMLVTRNVCAERM